MKLAYTALALAALGLVGTARAGFTNGGFEDGTFNGWTVRQGFNNQDNDITFYGGTGPSFQADPLANVVWGAQNLASPAPVPTVVDKSGYTDPYFPAVQGMFVGNKMAKLNDISGNYHVTQISQTGTINLADLNGNPTADVYINWAGIMQNPGHPVGANPWFIIDVTKNGSLFFEERHYSSDPGWNLTGPSIFQNSGQVHLSGLALGDQVGVELTVADCAWGGHGAYAYLDGIGTSFVPPPGPGVPDAASTTLLLIPALFGLALLRRRF